MVNRSGLRQYYVHYPFGQTVEAGGFYNTAFRFTSKERDDYGEFEFDYFGARYYDARIGSFSTVDKASQFASGYVYGGNNPLAGVDPDGNLFFLSALGYIGQAWTAYNFVNSLARGDYGGAFFQAWAYGVAQTPAMKHSGGTLVFNIAKHVAFNVGVNAMGNTMQGRSWSHGWGTSAGFGAASGVLSSQQFGNWVEHGEFRSTASMNSRADAQLMNLLNEVASEANISVEELIYYLEQDLPLPSQLLACPFCPSLMNLLTRIANSPAGQRVVNFLARNWRKLSQSGQAIASSPGLKRVFTDRQIQGALKNFFKNPNKLNHSFDNGRLSDLVSKFPSDMSAATEVIHKLAMPDRIIYKITDPGVFRAMVNVRGVEICVSGKLVEGMLRVGSIAPYSAEHFLF